MQLHHVITNRLVNADYIIRPVISTKRKFISEHTKTTTKYAAWFSGHGVVCPLFADVTFWNTQPIKTLMDWIKNKYYTMCEYISNASSFCCHFLLSGFLCVHLCEYIFQRFMWLLPFSFKLFPLCTSMWIHLQRFMCFIAIFF